MKKTLFAALAVLTVGTIGVTSMSFTTPAPSADATFEGVITYTVSVEGGNPQAAQMMKNATMTMYFKPGKSKVVMDMGMMKTTAFADKGADSVTTLMDMGSNKYISKTANKSKSGDANAANIKYLDDTKTIAGYNCKKAQITGKDGTPADVWYTEDIPSSYGGKEGEYSGLKGFPLQFSGSSHGMTITYTAQSVTKQSVSDDTFTIPSGYSPMPAGMRGGMGGH
jgi:GLPGLI family protein